jgi:hypothetical protein
MSPHKILLLPIILLFVGCNSYQENAKIVQLNSEIKNLKKENQSLKRPRKPKVINTVIIRKPYSDKDAQEEVRLPRAHDTAIFKNVMDKNVVVTMKEDYLI